MFNKFLLPAVFAIVSIGCTSCSHSTPQPTKTVEPAPVASTHTEQPVAQAWQEVSQGAWTFKVPRDFMPKTIPDGIDIAAAFVSPDQLEMITFSSEKTELNLEDYTSASAAQAEQSGAKVVQARAGHIGPEEASLLILEMPNTAIFAFNVVKGGTAYNLACIVNAASLETHAKMCFDIAKTLRIK
jgi:hypothetical protein